MAVVPFDPSIARARRATPPARPLMPPKAPVHPPQRTAPPAPVQPRLRVNLSPAAATRVLAGLGLGIALCATVATTLSLMGAHSAGGELLAPTAVGRFTAWLVSLPWLFLAVTLVAVSRIERLARPGVGHAWTLLALVAALVAALQVGGADALRLIVPSARAAIVVGLAASVAAATRGLLTGESRVLRLQLVAAVTTGLVVTSGPFAMLGDLVMPPADRTAPLVALLAGSDALLGLVIATVAIHAALVYVRDFLPDFSIALDTTDEEVETLSRAPVAPRRG